MSFSSTTARLQYTGNGSTVDFAVTFPFQADADIAVVTTVAGADTTEILNVGYTVSGEGTSGGGNVRFVTAPASGTTITIYRNLDLNQTRDFRYNGSFPTTTVTDAADKAMQAIQQVDEKLKRTRRVSVVNAEMPEMAVADRASTVDGWDAAGLPTQYPVDVAVLPYAAPYVTSTITTLKAIPYLLIATGTQISVTDYAESGDGGGGLFRVDKSDTTTADDGGLVIVATDGTRLKRVLNGAVYNARMWGARGNDSTNDTLALNAALSAIPAGSALRLPSGTYRTNSDLLVTKAVNIFGDGIGKTTIYRTSAGASTYAIYVTASNVRISSLTLRGPSSAAYVINENGIYAKGTSGAHLSNVTVDWVEVYNFGSDGISTEYVDGISLSRPHVHDCGYAGIAVNSCTDGLISQPRIKDITPGTVGNAYGVYLSQRTDGDAPTSRVTVNAGVIRDIPVWEGMDTHGGKDITFSNNVITNCKMGIVATVAVEPTGSQQSERITITGNTISAGGHADPGRGIVISGKDSSARAKNIAISGNAIDSMGGTGSQEQGAIYVQYVDGLSISGCVVKNARSIGLNIYDAVTDFTVNGLTIDGVQTGYASACGILVGVGPTACRGSINGATVDASAETAVYFSSAQRGISWSGLKYTTSSITPVVGGNLAGEGFVLYGALSAYNFASIANASYDFQNITVLGAELGDYVEVSASITLAQLSMSEYISAANTATFTLYNLTGGAVDLGVANYTARVVKAQR